MKYKILIWDNDGTVTGSKNPNDGSVNAKIILPNVEKTMGVPTLILLFQDLSLLKASLKILIQKK
jgi:hypothetical protein